MPFILEKAVQHDPINHHRRHYRRHIIRGGSGRGSSARGWDVSNAELKQRIIELMSERNATGVAIDDAILGHLPEQHPMLNRLQIIAKLATQRDQLLASLKALLSSKAEPSLFAGVAAADNAAKLIKSIEDGEWIGAGHSPDAGKMVQDRWISTTDRLPDVTSGDELHCFVCHHNNSTGKDSVFDCYYVNKPIPGDDDDWESIDDNNGRPIAIVGWYFKGAHPDYSYYYEPVCEGVTDWQPVIYPAAPKLGGE